MPFRAGLCTNKTNLISVGAYSGFDIDGAYVSNLAEITAMIIRKLKPERGNIRINYGVVS